MDTTSGFTMLAHKYAMSVGSQKTRKIYMTHNDAYNIGWKDYWDGVAYDNPSEEVTDTEGLLRNWQRGWIDHKDLDF